MTWNKFSPKKDYAYQNIRIVEKPNGEKIVERLDKKKVYTKDPSALRFEYKHRNTRAVGKRGTH